MIDILKRNKENLIFYIIILITSLIFTKYYYLLTYESYPPAYASNVAEFTADKVFKKIFSTIAK